MRRFTWVLVLVVAVVLVATVPAAARGRAYVDSAGDPDDRPVMGFDPDLRASTRKLSTVDGHRVLRIVVRAYEDFGLYWFVTVSLDTRGGRGVDYVMQLSNQDLSGKGCSVSRPGRFGDRVTGAFRQHGDRAVCRVPARAVRPAKRIRWKLHSDSGYGGTTDYAPNGRGWFG